MLAQQQLIAFACRNCGTHFKTGIERAGRKAKCTKCQTVLTVPQPDDRSVWRGKSDGNRLLCAGLLTLAGLLTVVGTIAPWASLSGPIVLFGQLSWNGFGGSISEMRVNDVVLWQSPSVASSWGYVTLPLGLAIMAFGFLRLRNWNPNVNGMGKIAALILAVVMGIVSVWLFLSISAWAGETVANTKPGALEPSIGMGIWVLAISAAIAAIGGLVWPPQSGRKGDSQMKYSASIRLACPKCGKNLKAPRELAGKNNNCTCGTLIAVQH